MLTPDNYVTCPLDEAHRIVRSRLQYHLVRCLKNHKLDKKLRCPWNATHIIDKFAYEDHWRNKCENLPEIMGSVVCSTEELEQPALASAPATTPLPIHVPAVDDWDAEPYYGTYDPMANSESKRVLRCVSGLSKAKRKEWLQQERKRHQQLENEAPIQINKKQCPKPTKDIGHKKDRRQPHKAPLAMSANTSMVDNTKTSNIDENEPKLSTNSGLPRNTDGIADRSCDLTGSLTNETLKLDSDKSFVSVASTGTKTNKKSAAVKVLGELPQDEDVNFPTLASSRSRSSKADRFIDDKLSEQFESLVTMIKDTEKENIPNPQSAEANPEIKDVSAKTEKSIRKMLRCAANFEKLNISEDKNGN